MAQNAGSPGWTVSKDNRTLTVSASDHAEAEPEVADLNVGFVVYASTLPTAYKQASDLSTAIVVAMEAVGAKKSDMQSQSQRVSRLNDYEVKQQKGARFSVTQSWTVSIAPKDAALVLDAAVNAGANQSGDITWRMKSSVALDAEALRKATVRAKTLAVALAEGLGVTLGKPVYASNSVSGEIALPMKARNFAAALSAGVVDAKKSLMIEVQRVERDATVQIVFAMD